MAPFKFKFSRMSKSNSSTRSNSMETPAECESELNSPQSNVPAIMEAAEGQENVPSSPPPSYEFVLEEVSFYSICFCVFFLRSNLVNFLNFTSSSYGCNSFFLPGTSFPLITAVLTLSAHTPW